jgi:hypothetical protein
VRGATLEDVGGVQRGQSTTLRLTHRPRRRQTACRRFIARPGNDHCPKGILGWRSQISRQAPSSDLPYGQ